MNKTDFEPHVRYTVTLRDEKEKLRAANIYVLKLHTDGMVVRMTEREGLLRKLKYEDVICIVKATPVAKSAHYSTPEAILDEKNWKNRTEIQHYGSAPNAGK